MKLKPNTKINRSFSQGVHTSSCLHWSIRFPVHWSTGYLEMRQGSIIACENELNTKKTVKSSLKCLLSGFLLQQLYCSLEEIWPFKFIVQPVSAQVNTERGEKVGHLVDHSCGDPLHVKIPTPYNSTGCAQDGLSTAVPPQQKGLYCLQIPHRDFPYFSLLSYNDFGILSCPTAAVVRKQEGYQPIQKPFLTTWKQKK